MEYDENRVDDMMLALLWLNMFDQGPGTRVWKRHDFKHMDRLHEKGFIDNPKGKTKTAMVTRKGVKGQKSFSEDTLLSIPARISTER